MYRIIVRAEPRKPYRWMNGEIRAACHPETFEIPTAADRAALEPGDFAKAGVEGPSGGERCGERFWVKITGKMPGGFIGTVDNDLISSEQHGMRLGDVVMIRYRNVLDVMTREDRQ